eukprot:CAMPEP_0194214290 /NCGR_PEP_ID=MMETSP0156-20130528/15472_1 /TAXON_ID=33649 /ORGANISM="Thalassionema nitzschioides, Strain L26-B" /LENGTH=475 /DNA_ID=CAMNT_0038942519 /DNA_START=159 /DNA_END=1583 /DNA_ORIENTATION=-
MRANEITYPSSHNAMSSRSEGFIAPNNNRPLEEAMEDGIRGFLLDSCDCGSTVEFCHSKCFLGTKDPRSTFDTIANFLTTEKPNDIIVLEIQVDDGTLHDLWSLTSKEFRDLVYSKTRGKPWPTLNEMIDEGRRIIVFQHKGTGGDSLNCSNDGECPEGVHDFYDYAFQTDWDYDEDELLDFDLSCQVKAGDIGRSDFIANNHFARNPLASSNIAKSVNVASVLRDRMEYCSKNVWGGENTTLLVVDFWSIGDVVKVANDQNKKLAGIDPGSDGSGGIPAIDIGCFSRDSTIEKENGEVSTMEDLKLGDRILVSHGTNGTPKYEPVYSFAHYHETKEANFVVLLPSKLELTPHHLIFIEGQNQPIPAALVRVGDVLEGGSKVQKVRHVIRQGMYAPFTQSGTIIVNGVKVSNYVALQDLSPWFQVGSIITPFSYHWLSHLFLVPYRLFRQTRKKEKYDADGIVTYLHGPYLALLW